MRCAKTTSTAAESIHGQAERDLTNKFYQHFSCLEWKQVFVTATPYNSRTNRMDNPNPQSRGAYRYCFKKAAEATRESDSSGSACRRARQKQHHHGDTTWATYRNTIQTSAPKPSCRLFSIASLEDAASGFRCLPRNTHSAKKNKKRHGSVNDQRSTVSSQWSAVSSQRSTGSSQRENGQRSTVNGQKSTASSQRPAVNGQQSMVRSQRSAVNGQQ